MPSTFLDLRFTERHIINMEIRNSDGTNKVVDVEEGSIVTLTYVDISPNSGSHSGELVTATGKIKNIKVLDPAECTTDASRRTTEMPSRRTLIITLDISTALNSNVITIYGETIRDIELYVEPTVEPTEPEEPVVEPTEPEEPVVEPTDPVIEPTVEPAE